MVYVYICMCNTYVVVAGFLILSEIKKLSATALRVHPLPTDRVTFDLYSCTILCHHAYLLLAYIFI